MNKYEIECNIWFECRVEARYEVSEAIYYFLNSDGPNKDLEDGNLVRVRI